MIKLSRGEKPEELTNDVCEELKKLYAEVKIGMYGIHLKSRSL